MNFLEIAKEYFNAGFSVIPTNEKKVPIGSWKKSTESAIEPSNTFTNCAGIGIVCGVNDIEAIDFDLKYDDTGTLFTEYKELVKSIDPHLLSKMTVQSTKNAGFHFVYKCKTIDGNKKLANKENKEVLIETRGRNGYIQVAPTEGYKLVYGSFLDIKYITEQERQTLFDCAKTFNKLFEDVTVPKEYRVTDAESPFNVWHEKGNIPELLRDYGWTLVSEKGKHEFWLRPDGKGVHSADWCEELRSFHVFTSSTAFKEGKSYNPLGVLTTLKFNGNFSESAIWLLKNGYGVSNKPQGTNEQKKTSPKPIEIKATIDESESHVADESEITEYLTQWRRGTFVKGLSTGMDGLDKYFLFKRGNFNVVNGIDNIGKSTGMWYLCLLSALFHDWKWLIYSNENRAGAVTKKMIEFYWGVGVRSQSEAQYNEAFDFVKSHFTIISNKKMYNYMDLLQITTIENAKKKHDGLLVDPYNSLMISLSDNSKLSTHEYHYQAASEMQLYSHREDTCIYLSCHVITSALREQGKAPKKGDTEGGAKFANKADDFMTFHRLPYDPDKMNEMQIHVRKIKEVETGGGYTPEGQPFILKLKAGFAAYEDEYGFDPIEQWRFRGKEALKGKQEQISYPDKFSTPLKDQIKPNDNWETEPINVQFE